jgi:hypothetical protein
MRLPLLFLVASVLALVFGLGFLLFPSVMLPIYGVDPEPAAVLLARFFGVALVHLGVALCLMREVRDPTAQRGLLLAGVVGSAAGIAVGLMGVLGGVVNATGWSTVAIYALLLLGYASAMRTRTATA